MKPTDDSSLRETKQWVRQHFDAGSLIHCPCCGQIVKKYSRSINATIAGRLSYLLERRGWVHVGEFRDSVRGGDQAKAAYWGLVETDGAGRWRLTEKGRQFVKGEITIPKYAYIYNDRVIGYSEQQVSYGDCAPKRFRLEEDKDPAHLTT